LVGKKQKGKSKKNPTALPSQARNLRKVGKENCPTLLYAC